jgi:hypothetical protein
MKDARVSLAKVIEYVRLRQKINGEAMFGCDDAGTLKARHRHDAFKDLADALERDGESVL